MLHSKLGTTARWFLYALLIGCCALVPRLDMEYFIAEHVFHETSEYTALELFQTKFLLLCSLLFALSARQLKLKQQQPLMTVSVLLCGFFCCLLIREADYYLDYLLFDGAWQTLVSITLLSMLTYAWLRRQRLPDGIGALFRARGFNVIALGLLILIIYSRLLGKGDFWETLMGDHYLRPVKDVVEEGIELLGTAILFMGSVEFLIQALPRRSASKLAVR